MADIALAQSPLAPGRSPVRIRIRESGSAACAAVVFLHSGWGYEIYPFDRQAAAFADRLRSVMPDRSGYGGSTPIDDLPADFHHRAATETLAVVDALGLDAPILWGHSDGAIIALLIGLASPDRVSAIVVEATHLWKRKPASRAFFDAAIANPDAFRSAKASRSESIAEVLARDHGERWKDVIALHAKAWRKIADQARSDSDDFYDGRLGALTVPVLVVHGARDPRTEPGELDALTTTLRGRTMAKTEVLVLADGGHSPHSERASADRVTEAASAFAAGVIAASKDAR